MYNSDLASDIEKAVQNALATCNFSELNKDITTAVNTSIAQIGTNQNRFYRQYENAETTAEQLEHVDGEVVNGDMRADYNARRQSARAEAERARYNSRQATEARRQAAEDRRRAAEARRRAEANSRSRNNHSYSNYSERFREAAAGFGFFGSTGNSRTAGNTSNRTSASRRNQNPAEIVPISRNPAGRVSGILLSVFGWLGLACSAMMFIMFSLFEGQGAMSYAAYDTLMGSLFTPVLLISGGMTYVGTRRRHRVRRFYQYVRQLRGRTYCSIKELSSHIGRSDRFVLKDLRKMISLGMFPEGHIDDQQTCVMLNGPTYDQYRKAQNAYLTRQMGETQSAGRIYADSVQTAANSGTAENISNPSAAESRNTDAAHANTDAASRRSSLPPKVIQVLSAGDSYLTKIREANAAIPGEVISAKLDHLEEIIRKIYARIEVHPEQVDDLDKFINYYLPTTLKLVDAYRNFDAQSVQGDNIKTAKKEIESTLDTIIYAFETLLDSLYEDDALDISTDISVLQTMFAQEGLTKGAFDKQT